MKLPIYLDYAATTPVDSRVAEKMAASLSHHFANAASTTHVYGENANALVELAREQVASLIGAESREIIFTSGATESNNLAIQGVAFANRHKGNHIITCKTEHKAVLDVCAFLETQGFEITYLPVQSNGRWDLALLEKHIKLETILISVMHVNNEIGVVQDIAKISDMAHKKSVLVHVDAAQGLGKLPIDVKAWDVDLLSISAHKLYGPKGIGGLYVRHRPKIRLQPLIYGGGQERGLRAGTLATHQIVGLGEACHIIQQEMPEESIRIQALRDQLWQGISILPKIIRNGDPKNSVPGILSVSFEGVDGEALIMALQETVAVSAGSACTSATMEVSHVLRALGVPVQLAQATLRFSIGRFTTLADIEKVIQAVVIHVNRLRSISPLWRQ